MESSKAERVRSFIICSLIAANILLGFRMLLQYGTSDTALEAPKVLGAQTMTATYDAKAPAKDQLLALINEERRQQGLPALEHNSELEQVANIRANDMVQRNYYAHQDPSGYLYHDYFRSDTFRGAYSCENLDLAFTALPQQYIADWLSSGKGHRQCMLSDKITDVGFAVAKSHANQPGHDIYIVVAIHAARAQ